MAPGQDRAGYDMNRENTIHEECSSSLSTDSVHELFSDHELQLLNPLLAFLRPPDVATLSALLDNHSYRAARPGGVLYSHTLQVMARYCFLRGSDWDDVSLVLSERMNAVERGI